MKYQTIRKWKDRIFWFLFCSFGLAGICLAPMINNNDPSTDATVVFSPYFLAALVLAVYFFFSENYYYNTMHKQKSEGY